MSDNTNQYSGASIEVLKGLEPVRRRPGMYTDTQNPNHLGMEVIDNSVDEAVAGFADRISVILHEDQSLEVTDNGRGMPVDLHPEEKIPAIELILTKLHAGGKFNSDSYKFSGGLHGVGVSVVNALSKKLTATVKRGGIIYQISYENGVKNQELTEIGTCAKKDTGTSVHFWPDEPYFDDPKFNVSLLKHLLKAKAVLCPDLTIEFTDRISNQSESWSYNGTLDNYLITQTSGRTIEPVKTFFGQVKNEDSELEWAVAWELEGSGGQCIGESFVNLIPTVDGGTHVNGFRTGLTNAIREFCDLHSLLPRNLKITAEDVWSRCSFVLSLKMVDPQFAGQTKEKLSSRHIASVVEGIISDRFSLWLNSNVETATVIANLIIDSAKDRESQAKVVDRKKVSRGPALPGKLWDCTSTDPSRGELFIVEGDSAGGSARQARDASFQAILPLRGKILNTWEVSPGEALQSEEIRAISVSIGVDLDSDSLEGLRYNKICILADADCDGLHIGTLLCCLFVKHFTKLVREGHIYVACPPLYRIDCGKEKEYAIDDEELEVKRKRFLRKGVKAENIRVQRFKGLGEMNPNQLRETTLATESRRLKQLTLCAENSESTFALMDMLLSKKKNRASDRRQWLEANGERAEVLD
ncbi:MAG: DNA topoisomerase IV subunit B [Succinivibrio sp.]